MNTMGPAQPEHGLQAEHSLQAEHGLQPVHGVSRRAYRPSRLIAERIGAVAVGIATMGASATALAGAPPAAASARTTNMATMTVAVKEVKVRKYGEILENQSGLALYYLSTNHPPKTWACSGACLTAWPPLVLPKDQKKPKIAKGLMGISTIKGPSGVQVTYKGKPLYTFYQDSKGTVKGQGIHKVWWVAQVSAARTTAATGGGW